MTVSNLATTLFDSPSHPSPYVPVTELTVEVATLISQNQYILDDLREHGPYVVAVVVTVVVLPGGIPR